MTPPRTRSALYRIAAIHFTTFAARGFAAPFISLYLISVGFSGTQIGLLSSVSALLQLTLAPLLHRLADRTGRHRQLYYALLTGNITASLGIVAFAANTLPLSGMILMRDSSDAPSTALLSQLTITWLDKKQNTYGRLRAWGSFGYAMTTMISGYIFAAGGYGLLFVAATLLNLTLYPMIQVLPARTAESYHRAAPHKSVSRGLVILLASLFLYFVGSAAFNSFMYVYFKQSLGASNALIGVIACVSALSEIPAMMLIDRILRRADLRIMLPIGVLGLGALWFILTQVTGTGLLIPLIMLRGTFYTLQLVCTTLLVSEISLPANVATNQALAQVTVPGLAILLTGSLNGWLFDHAGARVLFQIMALLSLLSVALLVATRAQLHRPTEDNSAP